MTYHSPRAIESAAKEAAKKSPLETSRALTLFWWDRFLTRVFSSDEPEFVLKGGMSMLARMGSRFTKDIDLATEAENIDSAQSRLIELVSRDLGDFFHFEFISAEPITIANTNLTGRRLGFSVIIGGAERGRIRVDLVSGCNPVGFAEVVAPAHRLSVKGLVVSDYYLYPLVDTLADKICATLAPRSHNRGSSRTKDLVDIISIAQTAEFDACELATALNITLAQQGVARPQFFSIPQSWKTGGHNSQYRKLAQEASLSAPLDTVEVAERYAREMIDPILSHQIVDGIWNPISQQWENHKIRRTEHE